MDTSYDYIIVGAGPSTIGLLLGLLDPFVYNDEDNFPFSIAIIERGPANCENDAQVGDLSRWFQAAHDRSSPHVSILSACLSSRRMDVPVGRGVGGGSNINAGLCIAPPKADFRDWPEPWRTELASSIETLQRRLAENGCLHDAATGKELTTEDIQSCDGDRDNGNPFKCSKGRMRTVPCLARRVGNNQLSTVERVNYYQGLLEPLFKASEKNSNHDQLQQKVHWFYNTEAQRLLCEADDSTRVKGVEVRRADGSFVTLLARKEVILGTGAIETPALLIVSGIGPGGGAMTLHGIGQNLRDHVILPRVLLGPPLFWRSTINGIHSIYGTAIDDDNKFLILTSTTSPEIALHYMTEVFRRYWFCLFATNWASQSIWWTLNGILHLVALYSPAYFIMMYGLTTINLALVNPKFKGSISLKPKSDKSNVPPRRKDFDCHFDLAYVRGTDDVEALWAGWIASHVVLDPYSYRQKWEVYPGRIFRLVHGWFGENPTTNRSPSTAPNWFVQYAQDHCLPFFHWCGTCAMNTHESVGNDWVLDADLRVRCVRSLRVCDASAFPNNLSVPPALACAAMGHLLAAIILSEAQ